MFFYSLSHLKIKKSISQTSFQFQKKHGELTPVLGALSHANGIRGHLVITSDVNPHGADWDFQLASLAILCHNDILRFE